MMGWFAEWFTGLSGEAQVAIVVGGISLLGVLANSAISLAFAAYHANKEREHRERMILLETLGKSRFEAHQKLISLVNDVYDELASDGESTWVWSFAKPDETGSKQRREQVWDKLDQVLHFVQRNELVLGPETILCYQQLLQLVSFALHALKDKDPSVAKAIASRLVDELNECTSNLALAMKSDLESASFAIPTTVERTQANAHAVISLRDNLAREGVSLKEEAESFLKRLNE